MNPQASSGSLALVGPKAKKDGPFEAVYLEGLWYWKCRKSGFFATIVGTRVTYHGKEPKRTV